MSSVFSFQLRYLQTLNSISAENNSTVIFPVPIDIMSQLMGNRQQQQYPNNPMFMQQQQQPLQPQQMGPQQQQQQLGAGGHHQSYPKSSLKKSAPPAPTHTRLQRGARRSVRKSKVRKNNWSWVLLIDPDRRFTRLACVPQMFYSWEENIIFARLKGSSLAWRHRLVMYFRNVMAR